jgi:prepilin-type N-terminal cleavage/methylation domain-containing protein
VEKRKLQLNKRDKAETRPREFKGYMPMMKNRGGFTLTEVVVVMAVLSVSVYLSAGVFQQMDRSLKNPESQVNLSALSVLIRETLRYRTTCTDALQVMTGMPPGQITGPNGLNLQMRLRGILGDGTPGDDVLQTGVRVQHLNITRLRTINSINIAAGKYYSEVEVAATVAATGLPLKPIIAGGFYYSLAGNTFVSCDTPGEDPTPLCEEMGCKWDLLTSPPCTCDPIDLSCPPQEFLTGVNDGLTNPDDKGKPICTPLGSGPCPAGQFLYGIKIGLSDCRPLTAAPAPTP